MVAQQTAHGRIREPHDRPEQAGFTAEFQVGSAYRHPRFARDKVQADFVIAVLQEQIGSAGNQMVLAVSGVGLAWAACGAGRTPGVTWRTNGFVQ